MITSASVTSSVSRSAGGLFESVRRLNQSLLSRGQLEVLIFGLRDAHTDQDAKAWLPLRLRTFPVIGPARFGYAPDMSREMLSAKLDILHCHGIWKYPALATLQWSRRTRRPYVISPHGMIDPVDLAKSRLVKAVAKMLYQGPQLRSASCMRSLCQSESDSIRLFGLRNPICQIPNGVDLTDDNAEEVSAARAKHDVRTLLYLGRINRKKNIASLVSAWKLLHDRRAPGIRQWELAICGWSQDGHEDELKQQAAALGIADSISFPGPRFGKEKEAMYHNADAFVLPSLSEGLPMVVLEAWSHRLPVVMTPECNIPEGFAADAAIKVEASAESIADGLGELLSMDESQRRQTGERGRALVERRFTWPKVACELRSVYEWLLGGGAPPGCVRMN